MTTGAIVGGTCLIFAAGVVAGKVAGASWRWSSVNTMTNMVVFGSLIAIINRVIITRYLSVLAGAVATSQFLSAIAGIYVADRITKQPKNPHSGVIADLAVIVATVVCAIFISDRFLCEW